ncbi:hypothetical protein PV325_007507 [Microctonus aethiopoides]|nr:hypothetical protein PV325_007507 [Microctonus aethiopoides]
MSQKSGSLIIQGCPLSTVSCCLLLSLIPCPRSLVQQQEIGDNEGQRTTDDKGQGTTRDNRGQGTIEDKGQQGTGDDREQRTTRDREHETIENRGQGTKDTEPGTGNFQLLSKFLKNFRKLLKLMRTLKDLFKIPKTPETSKNVQKLLKSRYKTF